MINRRIKFLVFIILLVILFFQNSIAQDTGKTIYVSPTGNDGNNGTIAQPVLTINKALKLAEATVTQSIHIQLRGGLYIVKKTIAISNSLNAKSVTISNYKEEKVTLSGGRHISIKEIKKTTDSDILNRLTGSAKNNIYEIDLKKIGIVNYGTMQQHGDRRIFPAPLEMFFNDKVMDLARWPNHGYLPIGKVTRSGALVKNNKGNQLGAIFQYTSDKPNNWKKSDQIWISGFLAMGYSNDNIKISNLNTGKREITLQSANDYGVKSSVDADAKNGSGNFSFRRFYFYNVLEELDQPGEWFLDREAGVLYFYPPGKLNDGNIYVSLTAEPLISLINSQNIKIRGIEFAYGRDMGLFAKDTKNVVIEKCVFKNFGTFGVSLGKSTSDKKYAKSYDNLVLLDNNSNFILRASKIFNTGTGGVFLTGGNRAKLLAGNNKVQNCEIYNFARRNIVGCPAIFVGGVSNLIINCFLHDSEGQAITFWGNNHNISFNKISKVSSELNDLGAVYTGRDPSSTGTSILNNFFDEIKNDKGYSISAIYIDDASGGITINDNIFNNSGTAGRYKFGAIHINGGGNNTFDNNYFINCEIAISMTSWDKEHWNRVINSPEMKKKLNQDVQINSSLYIKRYPYLKGLTSDGYLPHVNKFSNTLIYNVKVFTSNTRGIVQSNTVRTINPGFIDIARKNFEIKNDVPSLKSIKKIDFSKIGIKN